MRLTSLTVTLCLLCTGLIVGAQRFNTAPPQSEFAHLMQELQFTDGEWCWRGLCLGKTTLDQAKTRIRGDDIFNDLELVNRSFDRMIEWSWRANPKRLGITRQAHDSEKVDVFSFDTQAEHLTLADLVNLVGTPEDMYIQLATSPEGKYSAFFIICFDRYLCGYVLQPDGNLRPTSPITTVAFMNAAAKSATITTIRPTYWRGFTTYQLPH